MPDTTAHLTPEAGLLAPKILERLFEDALRRQKATERLLALADVTLAAEIEPMSMEEIYAEVKVTRAGRHHHATGR